MYSFLTIKPLPADVPENIHQVFEDNGAKIPGETLVDYTFLYKVVNLFKGQNSTKILQKIGKHGIGKVKFIWDLVSFLTP